MLRRPLKLMGLFLKVSVLNVAAYRFDMLVRVLVSLMHLVADLGSVWIIFHNTKSVAGWTAAHMMVLVGVFRIVAGGIQNDSDEFSGINVTPMVDVVLVLLVIFMITAPTLYQQAMKVQLPTATQGDGQSKGTLTINLDAAGGITIEDKTYTLEGLAASLQANKPSAALILADKKVEHGKVISLLDVLKGAGIQKFSFGVETAAK